MTDTPNHIDKDKADQLQFLRFICFLLICVFHSAIYGVDWFPGRNGAANAVEFFIVLSGFGSGYSSYFRSIELSFKSERVYLWKKLTKVYPLYFVTTTFMIGFSGIPGFIAYHQIDDLIPKLKQLIRNLLLIQSWFPEEYFSFNGVGWFLSTAFFLYAVNIPLRAVFSKIRAKNRENLIYIAIAVLSYITVLGYCYATRYTEMEYTQYTLPISRLGEYITGMSLGYLIRALLSKEKISVKYSFEIFSVLEICTFSFWVYNMYLPMPEWHYRIIHWFIPNCILICVFACGKGVASKLFRARFLVYLGDISFECFLIHGIVIYLYSFNGLGRTGYSGNVFSIAFIIVETVLMASIVSKKSLQSVFISKPK